MLLVDKKKKKNKKKRVSVPFNSPRSRDYATPPRGSTPLRPVEGAVEPGDESFPAAAPLLLTRIHPYCTGRVGGRRRRTEHRKQINAV